RHKRPGHGLDHAACRERALGLAGAQLERREDRLARKLGALEWRRRHAIDPNDAHDLLYDVGFALHVQPPRWHRDLDLLALARNQNPKPLEDAAELWERNLDAGEPLELAQREIDHQLRHLRIARDRDLRWRAAAEIEHQPGGELEPGHEKRRIDAALEAIAR